MQPSPNLLSFGAILWLSALLCVYAFQRQTSSLLPGLEGIVTWPLSVGEGIKLLLKGSTNSFISTFCNKFLSLLTTQWYMLGLFSAFSTVALDAPFSGLLNIYLSYLFSLFQKFSAIVPLYFFSCLCEFMSLKSHIFFDTTV